MQSTTALHASPVEEMWAICQQADALRKQRYGQGHNWQILRHWHLRHGSY
jgi:hypothetical protein